MTKNNSIENFYNKNKKSSITLILLFIIVFLIMTITCVAYLFQLKAIIKNESIAYLDEISNHEALMIERRVNAQLSTLSMLADSIALDSTNPDYRKIMGLLEKEREYFHYKHIGVILPNGDIYSTNSSKINISKSKIHDLIVNVKNPMADILVSPFDNEQSFIFIIPIINNNNIIAHLIVSKPIADLTGTLSLESFNGEGYIQVLNQNGDFITKSVNKNAIHDSNNFFIMLTNNARIKNNCTVDKIMSNFKNGKNGFIEYTTKDGINKFVQYKKLSVCDWYLLTIVPSKILTKKTTVFITATAIISLTLIMLFLLLTLIIKYTQNKNKRELEKITLKDSVTDGISNAYFEFKAKKLIEKSKPSHYSFVSLDISKFKLINDSYGTVGGNETLRYIYNKISNSLDKDELAVRTESDHFCILIKSASKNNIIKRLDDLKDSINSFNDKYYEKYYINYICGICYVDDIKSSIISIRDKANTARKEAKNNSQNYFFYSEFEKDKLIKEKDIENMMHDALAANEFEVYLQPKYELENNTIAGAEALVRWDNQKYGLMPPGEFIPIFEKNEFIISLDIYVFKRVCQIIKSWIDSEIEPITISINLSRQHFKDLRFLDKFVEIVNQNNIPPKFIEIELTETLIFENMDRLIVVVNEIHKAGFTCSIDDFGSGYSTLNMLKDIPVDVLKLDKIFFTNDEQKSERGNKVIESVIDLARKLDIKTVSEGVEHIPQVNFLKEAHCDMVQGYIFSKPVPVDTFEKLMIKSQKAKQFYLHNQK